MDKNQNPGGSDKRNKTDTGEIKRKIISAIRSRGPSLPVHIAREIKSDMLFTSAFLSELVSEKKLKLSNMRVGNSPLYLIPGQETKLENFTEYLNSKEKEALDLLKKEKTLEDSKQQPSIRVALRSLRDFAKPFKKEEKIFWRYMDTDEEKVGGEEIKKVPEPKSESEERELGIFDEERKEKEEKRDRKSDSDSNEEPKTEETLENKDEEKVEEDSDEIKLPEKPKEKIKVKERKKVRKKSKTSSSKTKKEKFFDKVKTYLDEQGIALKDIVGFGRGRISLIIEVDGEEKFLMAYDKKRINETDIGRASKGAKKHDLDYVVLSKGGPLKRIESLKKDLENLSEFKKL